MYCTEENTSVELTKSLRERFCKDNNINIKVFDEPYFSERLDLYNRAMPEKCIDAKYQRFCEYVNKFAKDKDYFDEYGRVKDAAISAIKTNEAYQLFNTADFNKCGYKYDLQYPEREIYKDYNVEKVFVSVDMKKANFTALRCYDPTVFGNADSWEEFVGKFTNSEYIKSSKYIRQVIMGNCNPSRQITYEKYLMGLLLKEMPLDKYLVVSVKNDEIIFDVTEQVSDEQVGVFFMEIQQEVLKAASKVNKFLELKVELFRIEKLEGCDGYKRIFFDGVSRHEEYKSISSFDFPIVLRKELGEEVMDTDKVFVFDGKLAKFL